MSITFLFLLLINKFLIFVINVYLNFLNLFIDERPVKRFDKKKFKNSSEEDQVSFLVSCSYLATGLLGANIVKKMFYLIWKPHKEQEMKKLFLEIKK